MASSSLAQSNPKSVWHHINALFLASSEESDGGIIPITFFEERKVSLHKPSSESLQIMQRLSSNKGQRFSFVGSKNQEKQMWCESTVSLDAQQESENIFFVDALNGSEVKVFSPQRMGGFLDLIGASQRVMTHQPHTVKIQFDAKGKTKNILHSFRIVRSLVKPKKQSILFEKCAIACEPHTVHSFLHTYACKRQDVLAPVVAVQEETAKEIQHRDSVGTGMPANVLHIRVVFLGDFARPQRALHPSPLLVQKSMVIAQLLMKVLSENNHSYWEEVKNMTQGQVYRSHCVVCIKASHQMQRYEQLLGKRMPKLVENHTVRAWVVAVARVMAERVLINQKS
jgi:hypothetical protein